MYKVIVPLFNSSVTLKNRDIYLKQFKDAKITEILLCTFGYGNNIESDKKTANILKENIEFFKNHGIKAGVWIGCTIGHGVDLSYGTDDTPDASKFTKMVDLAGQEKEHAFCPLNEVFRKRIAEYVSIIATSGAELILLDDDFRMSLHGPEMCCACDLHMARIRELCKEDISREQLKTLAFAKKPNKYRKAWLTAQKESLELLASDIRSAVNKTSPNTRVGFCTTPTVFGVDGTDPIQLAKLLAGNDTEPFIRLSGAPYWSIKSKKPMPYVIEFARMYAHFCNNSGIEMISEGDTYPRPRYNVPSSILEMFDIALRIDGQYDGILKYMVDYNSSPEFETSYLSRHTKYIPLAEKIEEMFADKQMLGVNVSCHRDLFADANLETGVMGYYPDVLAGAMMSFNGVSSVYGDGGICRAIFGEEARHIDLTKIEKGAIVDAVASQILKDRGVDLGLENNVVFETKKADYLIDSDTEEKAFVSPTDIRFAKLEISKNATPVCNVCFNEEKEIFAYTYENKKGARFLVYCFDAMALPRNTGMYRGYMQQKILKNGIEWISNKKLPAFIEKCPDLYVMCKGRDEKMAVALFNFFADSVDEPVIKLDKEYSKIRFINCNGKLKGDTVTLDSPIHAYTFVAFEVT